jgi:hypothetical protein
MVWSRLALTASLPALLAVPSPAAEADAEVPLLWVEAVSVPPSVRDAMVREIADILGPLGVRLRWRKGPPETESEPDEVRVVPLGPAMRRKKTERLGRVLGATSIGDGPRTIWIDYANVAWVAGTSEERLVSADFGVRRRVGVAMGRVLAHEVIHALAPEMPHSAAGLMGERLLGALERPASLDAGTRDAVRKALAQARRPEGEATASAR